MVPEGKVSRRKFLGVSTAVAAGGIVAGLVIGGLAGYFGGQAGAAPTTVTRTITGAPVTETVTRTVTEAPKPTRTILFGASLPLTGPLAPIGGELKFALEWVVNSINAGGGIYVKDYQGPLSVKLIVLDGKSDPAVSLTNVEKLMVDDKVDIILGELGGPEEEYAPVAFKHKTPYIGPVYVSDTLKKGYEYLFSPFHDGWDEAYTFFQWLRSLPKDIQPKTVVVWEEMTAAGTHNAVSGLAVAKELGFNVVLHEKYVPLADPSSFVLKLKEMNVDVIWGLPIIPDAINIVKRAKELDYTPKAWGFTRGSAFGFFGQTLGGDADYVLASRSVIFPYPGYEEAVKKYRAEIGLPYLLHVFYSEAVLAKEAIQMAGSLDKAKIKDALYKIDMMVPMGRMAFDKDGKWKYSREHFVLLQWQKGEQVVIWPPKYKEADGVYPVIPWKQRK